MSAGLTLIFWGLVLAFFDVTLNELDFLPDFLGYGLVASGARKLQDRSREMGHVRDLAWILVALELLGMFLGTPGGLGILMALVDVTMMWFLLGGVAGLAREHGRADLAAAAAWRRSAYLVLALAAHLLGVLAGFDFAMAGVLAVVITVCWIALLVLVLTLILRARRELRD